MGQKTYVQQKLASRASFSFCSPLGQIVTRRVNFLTFPRKIVSQERQSLDLHTMRRGGFWGESPLPLSARDRFPMENYHRWFKCEDH